MEEQLLPWANKVSKNVDAIELTEANQDLMDGYSDEAGFTHRRPGTLTVCDLGLGANNEIQGLFWWENKGYAIAVAAGRVFKLTYVSATSLTATELAGTDMDPDNPVVFVEDGTYCFMANGDRIFYTDGSTTTELTVANSPTDCSSIAYLDGYIIANDEGSETFYFAGPINRLSWSASDFASVVSNADAISAIKTYRDEIYFFGPKSVEIWQNDGTNPFSRIDGGRLEKGVAAPNSIIQDEARIFWLADDNHFVEFDGRSIKRIPSDYTKEVQSFSTLSDCRGFRIEINGKPFIVWSFPSEGRTLVYNLQAEDWQEWGKWISSSALYERWRGNCYCYCPAWGLHLIGDRGDSLICSLSPSYYDDDGDEIRLMRRTGHIDHGTTRDKLNHSIRFKVKRGTGDLTTRTPKLLLRWRDENQGWGAYEEVGLGDLGETNFNVELYRMGIYESRQYEIVATDPVPILFGQVTETFEYLR